MRMFHRLAPLSLCILILLSCVPLTGFVRPTTMTWEAFIADYEEAGKTGGTGAVKMTGQITLEGDWDAELETEIIRAYELPDTEQPVTVDADGHVFLIKSGAELTIDAPKLTITSNRSQDGRAILYITTGKVILKQCTIQTVNRAAIDLRGPEESLDMQSAEAVRIDVTYDAAAEELFRLYRTGIHSSQSIPMTLKNLDLTVDGGDAAIVSEGSVALYDCSVQATGEGARSLLFPNERFGLTACENSTLSPAFVPPDAKPPEEGHLLHDYAFSTDWLGYAWCLTGDEPAALDLPSYAEVWYKTEDENIFEDVPVDWALEELPENLEAGTYTVYGDFDAEKLAEYQIVNTNGIRPETEVRVFDPGPWTKLEAGVSAFDDRQFVQFKSLPPLFEATALYAQYSVDGAQWLKSEDLLDDYLWFPEDFSTSFTIGPSFYVRLVVEGSPFAGTTNTIKFGTPGVPDQPTDDSGGDHGGGGQGEATRPGREELPPVIQESLLERMRAQVAALLTFREKGEAVAEPEPTENPAAEAVLPEETAVEPDAAMDSSAPTAKPAPGPAPTPKSGAAPTPVPEAAPTDPPVLAVPEQAAPAPTPSTSRPPYQGGRAIEDGGGISPPGADSPAAPPSELPGFLVALAATGAVLLAGVGYGLWRKKKS